MRHEVIISLFILICISYGICFTSNVLAQSPSATIQPGVSLPDYIWKGPVPGGYITGYVVDMDGNPVPGATVSLLQDGQLWNPGKYSCFAPYPYGVNPQTTRIAYLDTEGFLQEGSFLFGLPVEDEYTLTAEKDGSNGSVRVYVAGDTKVMTVNITLNGYHQPTYSPEQLSYTGAITGNLMTASGMKVRGINMSLWQDGKLVNMPYNPQSSFERNFSGARVDYLFEHLVPGHYTVMAEYHTGGDYNDTVALDVGASPMRADIVLSQMFGRPADFPVNSFTPTVVEFSASSPGTTVLPSTVQVSEPRSTPTLPWMIVVVIIGYMACFVYDKNNKH